MKTFYQYITEGRDAPLFHGVKNVVNLAQIIFSKYIIPKTSHDKSSLLMNGSGTPFKHSGNCVKGVSASRSIDFAVHWAHEYKNYLVFDQVKVAQRYRIIPIAFWSSGGEPTRYTHRPFHAVDRENEYEEFVVSNKPIPLKPFVSKIIIDEACIQHLYDILVNVGTKHGLDLNIDRSKGAPYDSQGRFSNKLCVELIREIAGVPVFLAIKD